MKNYDVVIVGGGPGGYVAAIKAGQKQLKVALIEAEVVGGVCLNHGCIPTKTLLKSAKVYQTIKQAKAFGITVDGEISYNWAEMMKRKNGVVRRLTTGVAGLLKKNGVDVYQGFGEVIDPETVKVGNETLKAKHLIIATGASPIVPPIMGLKEAYEKGFAKTSREMLQIEEVPQELVIIGGGVIGVEFATIFNQLGSNVTIIEMQDGVLPMMDEDVRVAYAKILKRDGIVVHAKAEVKAVKGDKVVYHIDGKDVEIKADSILVSVGMRANTKGLEKLELKLERGAVVTDDQLRTNIKNVYAIGDVNGKYMLAHVASHEGIVAIENILGNEKKMHYDRMPSAVYGSPEIGAVGKTEKELKEQGIPYKVSTFPLMASGKALADNEKDGFVKLLVGEKYQEILGAHILSYNASDLIAELGVTMELEGTTAEIANTVHAHPTLSEIIMEAALGAIDKPIHL
ncbi:MAG: dihydrolipoyl dehydrogenase [Acholeplasmataceae bacterium]|nr:dihydrolipoyl dehydrogenase [Acholeplasmataceae bacterium]